MFQRISRLISQPSHRKRLKTAENKGFLTFLNAMGRSVPQKTPIRFQIANKINGFVHVSYGTALDLFCKLIRLEPPQRRVKRCKPASISPPVWANFSAL
jgi:hypothetical protein